MTTYEARPTEYNGITFRSKSEAIVARGFDIAGALWKYEPDLFDIHGNELFKDGYKPDFFVVHGTGNNLMQYYVEYKPKKPTPTYIKELYKRFKSIENIHTASFCVILCGSPFDDNTFNVYSIIRKFNSNDEYKLTTCDFENHEEFMYKHIEEAKSYRFDLVR